MMLNFDKLTKSVLNRRALAFILATTLIGAAGAPALARDASFPAKLRAHYGVKITPQNEAKALDRIYIDLRKAVQALEKEPNDIELLEETVRLASFALQRDPSAYAAEILHPLMKKNKESVEKAVQKLPAAEAKELRDSFKNLDRLEKEGNG